MERHGGYRPPEQHGDDDAERRLSHLIQALKEAPEERMHLQQQFGIEVCVQPFHIKGEYRVTVHQGGMYELYHCQPRVGRCSCGVTDGTCHHLAASTLSLPPPQPLYPLGRTRRKPRPLRR